MIQIKSFLQLSSLFLKYNNKNNAFLLNQQYNYSFNENTINVFNNNNNNNIFQLTQQYNYSQNNENDNNDNINNNEDEKVEKINKVLKKRNKKGGCGDPNCTRRIQREQKRKSLLEDKGNKRKTIKITQRAADKIVSINSKKKDFSRKLRIFINEGCGDVVQYSLDSEIKSGDICFKRNGAEVIIDEISLLFLQESTLDFEDEDLNKSGFVITDNPNSFLLSCGDCGSH